MTSIRFMILSPLCAGVYSFPISQQSLQEPACDPVELFTPEWFLQNTRPQYRKEIHGKALFYTRGASKHAQRLACGSRDYVSLWEIWPEWLYDDRKTPENRLRCIHSEHEKTKRFYENMSKAFARMARKHATVMHLSDDYTSPPVDGIWARIELPTLRLETDITEMTKRNEDASVYSEWTLPDKGARAVADRAIEEVQRIFRLAKGAWIQANPFVGDGGDACSLWASREDEYLASLW